MKGEGCGVVRISSMHREIMIEWCELLFVILIDSEGDRIVA